jgi:hypothetical protein
MNNVLALVRTNTWSDVSGVKYRYSLGPAVDVNTFIAAKALDESGKPKYWAREQISSIWREKDDNSGKKWKIWQRPFKDGCLHSLFVHPDLGAFLVTHKGNEIEDLWVIHEMAQMTSTSVPDRAVLKVWLEREHRFNRSFTREESLAWDILLRKGAKEEEVAAAEAAAKEEAERAARLEAQQAEERRLQEESRTRAAAHQAKIQAILSREKVIGITPEGLRLVAIPVEGSEYASLGDGTRCVYVQGEDLEFFEVSKSRGGRVGRKNLKQAKKFAQVVASPMSTITPQVKTSSLVGTMRVVRGEVEQDAPIFTEISDLKGFLKGHPDQIAVHVDGDASKGQLFSFAKGVLVSLGHHPVA